MSSTRHKVADDGLAIFDLRVNASFRKRLAGYDRREVELYIRRQDAVMTKIRLEKEQLERQVIRLRQQLADAREQLAEAEADLADAESAAERARAQAADPSDHEPEDDARGGEAASALPAVSDDAEKNETGESDAQADDADDTDTDADADTNTDTDADTEHADASTSEVVPSAS